jgi:hypothetical protein
VAAVGGGTASRAPTSEYRPAKTSQPQLPRGRAPAGLRPLGVAAYKRAGPEATEVAVLGGLGQAHVDGLETLGTFLKIELDRLTLFE